jgi:hypothetical protein
LINQAPKEIRSTNKLTTEINVHLTLGYFLSLKVTPTTAHKAIPTQIQRGKLFKDNPITMPYADPMRIPILIFFF